MDLRNTLEATFTEWAGEAGAPGATDALADAALRARTRRLTARGVVAALAVALVPAGVALAVARPLSTVTAGSTPRPGSGSTATGSATLPAPTSTTPPGTGLPHRHTAPPVSWAPLPTTHAHTGDTSVSAHPGEAPPVHFVAAHDVALSAWRQETLVDGRAVDAWHLYDAESGTYAPVSYAQLDVAPGLGLAAVLEGPGATYRIGILDMTTYSVLWIPTSEKVGTVAFSPDATKLVATTYTGDPAADNLPTGRNGIIVVDLTTGAQDYQQLPDEADTRVPYQGARWTSDGRYVYVTTDPNDGPGVPEFFTPAAVPVPPPIDYAWIAPAWGAGTSPDGTRYVDGPGVGSTLSRHLVVLTPMEQLFAWADNNSLVGSYCGTPCPDEFRSRLGLTTVGASSVVPLTGYIPGLSGQGSWIPLFTRR